MNYLIQFLIIGTTVDVYNSNHLLMINNNFVTFDCLVYSFYIKKLICII